LQVSLRNWIIEDMAVVLPLPVGPVTNTSPVCAWTISPSTSGRFNSLNVAIFGGIARITMPYWRRWRKMLTRKRPPPPGRA
jgi:hypothetical protein